MKRWLRHPLVIGSAAVLTGLAGLAGLAGGSARASTAPAAISPGTFGRVALLPVPDYVDSVAIGKVTGNGRNDLIVYGDFSTGYLWMYPQEKNGRLGAPQKFTVSGYPDDSPVTVDDLYGNGQNEVVLLGPGGLRVFGSKNGRLTSPYTIPIPTGVADYTVANVNGDRYPDIITSNGSSAVSVYYGSAKHTFRLGQTVRFTGGGVWYTSVFDAAFRSGDRADIAFYDGTDMDIRLHNANGTYGPMTRHPLTPIDGQVFTGVGQAAVGDLTGDGRPDLVLPSMANQPWSGVEVYADSKSGQLAKPVTYPTLDIPGQMTIADLTGNGRNDLVIEHDDMGYIGVMMQGANHRLGREALYPVENCCNFSFGGPAVGDLNGDGRPDLAVAASDDVEVLYQNK
jgi:FG-GAP repeat